MTSGASTATLPRPTTTVPHLPGRYLVVDDSESVKRIMQLMLTRVGGTVTLASDGVEAVEAALAALKDGPVFDVIFLDMSMPRMDGYEAASTLRRKAYQGAIVAVTAHALEGDRDKCLQAGCDDYLSKPVDRWALYRMASKYRAAGSKGG